MFLVFKICLAQGIEGKDGQPIRYWQALLIAVARYTVDPNVR